MALWEPELSQRIAHEKRPSTEALKIAVTEIAADEVFDIAGLQVRVVPVDHQPVRHAFGFVFEEVGEKLVLSGDTRRCEALIAAARGADLLVHEVFVHREMPVVEGVRSAETVANVASYHTLSDEVGKIAAEAGVKALALTHFVPPACDRAALLTEVAADFGGPLILAEDLLRIDLTARRVAYGQAVVTLGRG